MENQIVVFKDGALELDVKITPEKDTVWLTQAQLSELFQRERTVVTKYPDVKQKYRFEEMDEVTDATNQPSETPKPLFHEETKVSNTVFLEEEVILSLAFVLFKTKCLQAYAIRKFNYELMKAVPYVCCVFKSDCMKRLEADYPGFFSINNCGMYDTHVELPVLTQRVSAYIPNNIIQAAESIVDKMQKHHVNEDMFDAP